MASLEQQIKSAVDEVRILGLGCQVSLATACTSVFQAKFAQATALERGLTLAALVIDLLAFAILVWPAAFHQLALEGRDDGLLVRQATRATEIALLPVGLGLGLLGFVAGERILDFGGGLALGASIGVLALLLWYRPQIVRSIVARDAKEGPNVDKQIEHVLAEARVVLPGAQALLGFQFAAIFSAGFSHLSGPSKLIHLASFLLIAIATIILIAPAAYHRIVEGGEMTASFHRVAAVLLLGSLVPLGLGFAGDLYVVVDVVTGRAAIAMGASIGLLLFVFSLWFGFGLYCRRHQTAIGR